MAQFYIIIYTYAEARAALQYEDIKESTNTECTYKVARVVEPRRGETKGHVYYCYIFRGSKALYQAFESRLWAEEAEELRRRESYKRQPYLEEGTSIYLAVRFES